MCEVAAVLVPPPRSLLCDTPRRPQSSDAASFKDSVFRAINSEKRKPTREPNKHSELHPVEGNASCLPHPRTTGKGGITWPAPHEVSSSAPPPNGDDRFDRFLFGCAICGVFTRPSPSTAAARERGAPLLMKIDHSAAVLLRTGLCTLNGPKVRFGPLGTSPLFSARGPHFWES
jgi:hypothetical protein